MAAALLYTPSGATLVAAHLGAPLAPAHNLQRAAAVSSMSFDITHFVHSITEFACSHFKPPFESLIHIMGEIS